MHKCWQVQLTNLQTSMMHERGTATVTSDQLATQWRRQLDLEYQDWARLQGRGPHTAGGHGRNRHVGWQEQQGTELRGPARNLS